MDVCLEWRFALPGHGCPAIGSDYRLPVPIMRSMAEAGGLERAGESSVIILPYEGETRC